MVKRCVRPSKEFKVTNKKIDKSNRNLLYYYSLKSVYTYSLNRICIYCKGKFIANEVTGF